MIRFAFFLSALLLADTCAFAQDTKETPISKATLQRVGNVADKDFDQAVAAYAELQRRYANDAVQIEILNDVTFLKDSVTKRTLKDPKETLAKLAKVSEKASFSIIFGTRLREGILKDCPNDEERARWKRHLELIDKDRLKSFEADVNIAKNYGWALPPAKEPNK